MYGEREARRRRAWEEEARGQEARIMEAWTEKVSALHQKICGGPVRVDWQPRGFVRVRTQTAAFLEPLRKLEEELDRTLDAMWKDMDKRFLV